MSRSSCRLRASFVCLALAAVVPATAQSPAVAITGVVYVDRNANGRRDPSEPGIAGVPVTDQRDVVLTDAEGRYRLVSTSGAGIIGLSLPDGYAAARPWRAVPAGAATFTADFPLTAAPAPRRFTFLHASDTHIAEASVARTRRLKALTDSLQPAFVLVSGDLTRDALRVGEAEARSYFALYVRETANITVPVWSVPGNHENFGIERTKSGIAVTHPLYGKGMYRAYLGPTYYGFTFGGVHFLGLDTVDYDDMSYYGHVDSTQLAWIDRELATVPAGMPVVTFNHIPFASGVLMGQGIDTNSVAPSIITVRGKALYRHVTSNADEVLKRVTATHPLAVALGGHYHTREQVQFEYGGRLLRFAQTSAVVGPVPFLGGMQRSGVTLYQVIDGQVDGGTFIPLDPSPAAR